MSGSNSSPFWVIIQVTWELLVLGPSLEFWVRISSVYQVLGLYLLKASPIQQRNNWCGNHWGKKDWILLLDIRKTQSQALIMLWNIHFTYLKHIATCEAFHKVLFLYFILSERFVKQLFLFYLFYWLLRQRHKLTCLETQSPYQAQIQTLHIPCSLLNKQIQWSKECVHVNKYLAQ